MHSCDPDALAASLAGAVPFAAGFEDLAFDHLCAAGRIDALLACELLLRHAQALHVLALAALHRAGRDDPRRRAVTESEVTAATLWPVGTVHNRLAEADALTRLFPETLAALLRGQVSRPRAKALVAITACLSDQGARSVQERVPARMPTRAPAVTRRHPRRAVHAVDIEGAAGRHVQAVKRRRIEVRAQPDAMATLCLYTGAESARGILWVLSAHCKRRAKGEHRPLEQRRADALAALLLTRDRPGASQGPGIPAATAHLIVNIETVMGLSDAPGELEGYGPLTAARAGFPATEPGSPWRKIYTAPTGTLVHADPRTYRPTAALTRHMRARDRTRSLPGCHTPAHTTDPDHTNPFGNAGPTSEENPHPARRTRHNQKTAAPWTAHREGHTIVWTSTITARRYISTPEPYTVPTEHDLTE